MMKTKLFGKLTTMDLPLDLRKKLVSASTDLMWRPKTLERIFASLEAQIIMAKKYNDFAQWRELEDIGNKIKKWIEADPQRSKKFLEDCHHREIKSEDPFFY